MVLIDSWNWGGCSGGRDGGGVAAGRAGVASDGVYVGMTALGAALVFLTKEVKRWVLDAMLGFAGGVMIAASYFSLLAPAIELSEAKGGSPWIPAVVGFMAGGIFLRTVDRILPHLHPGDPIEEAEGISTTWRRSVLFVSAITLHNIPEGLAVGVAFGAVAAGCRTCRRPPRSRRPWPWRSASVYRTSRREQPSPCP